MTSLDFTSAVLSIDLICDCICDFLPLEDLKLFRLVSRKWKDISDRTFKKRVRICFDFDHRNGNNKSFNQYPAPEDLNSFFQISQMTYPFTALRLRDVLPWTNSALTDFFSTEGKHITDLVLYEVKLKSDENTANEFQKFEERGFQLMSILGGIVNLEKLDVQCLLNGTRFTLTLHDLAQIQYIRLQYCTVEKTDCRITPRELDLDDITFVQGGKFVNSILLNDFVTFTLMQKLTMSFAYSNSDNCKITRLKLNLLGSEKVKFVEVRHGGSVVDGEIGYDIVDFKNSSWEIETLELYAIPFQQENNMIIRNISMDNIHFTPHHFPQSLQKLCLTDEIEFPENLFWNFSLPTLQILDLTGTDTINLVFPHLLNCFPNLIELKLRSGFHGAEIAEIDVNLIPPHVQKILIFDELTDFDFVGEEVRAVETVLLKKAVSDFAVKVCNYFVPNNLIVIADNDELKVDMEQSLFVALSKIRDHGIIFGLFYDKDIGNEKIDDFVFPTVDTPGEFYSYINERGEVVKWEYGVGNQNTIKFTQFQSWLNSSDE